MEEAFAEAEQQQVGLLDPDHGCTIPAQLEQATSALPGYTGSHCCAPGGKLGKPC